MSSRAIEEIIAGLKDGKEITSLKTAVAKKYRLSRIPTNPQILAEAGQKDRPFLEPLLRKKPVRTISGIAVIAVMARPYACPGACIYCPQGEGFPKSYTGREPAAMRAMRSNFDPYLQVKDRLNQLKQIGHAVDKAELIIMGGTFNAQPREYQEGFVTRCLEAMNDFEQGKKQGSQHLQDAQGTNEEARVRNVGITLETRPDYSREEHVDEMLRLGVTRVELGVQSIVKGVYEKVKRGHSIADVVDATQILRDAGLKVGYHMMPGLFAGCEEDLGQFRELFTNENYKPDFLKIYPTLVIKGTKLYELWKLGEYAPYSDTEALKLLVEIKRLLPKWTRVMRIQRDIPSYLIEAGVKKGDLGARVYSRVRNCRCIRCREAGHKRRRGVSIDWAQMQILDEVYEASGGVEHFISIEDPVRDVLIAYLRLRFPSEKAHRREVNNAAMVRELRVLGRALRLGVRDAREKQHRGLGRELLARAEETAAAEGYKQLLITSAIGTREYYRKLGYRRVGPYMGKSL